MALAKLAAEGLLFVELDDCSKQANEILKGKIIFYYRFNLQQSKKALVL